MSLLTKVESILSPITDTFDNKLFLTQLYEPSKIYKAADLLSALSIVGNEPGIADKTFYLGEEGVDLGWEYGLVNLAAFLAQCMKETILYDACDENNWVSLQPACMLDMFVAASFLLLDIWFYAVLFVPLSNHTASKHTIMFLTNTNTHCNVKDLVGSQYPLSNSCGQLGEKDVIM
jgi:hypothetical protein